ncbi:MAG: (d)CMP kinase [Bdellovibrionales bacterium]|nr:(d)CMP kinase [Bdellovibrionales bacterium]
MSNLTANLITIDGPAASGKSSVSRELARKLGWKWVSTGAFYRGLAYVAMKEGVAPTDTAQLVRLAHSGVWSVRLDEDQTRVFYKKDDVTVEILSEENGTRASKVSQIPEVRQALLENQRDCAVGVTGLVAEGRDCGTVVFPQALLKIYLTASQEERAARRAREHGLNVQETQNSQQKRDQQDSSRAAAPLQIPDDARVVDSGGMGLAEVVEKVYSWATQAMAQSVKSF